MEPVATKCSFNYQAQPNRVSTSQSLKSHFITIQNVPVSPVIKKTRLLPSVLRLPSINPKVFFRQPSSEQSQRKAEWPPWDLRLVSQMANLFNSTHECLGQKKSLEGVLHKCQLGCRRQANPSSESKSFLVNQLLRDVGVILS